MSVSATTVNHSIPLMTTDKASKDAKGEEQAGWLDGINHGMLTTTMLPLSNYLRVRLHEVGRQQVQETSCWMMEKVEASDTRRRRCRRHRDLHMASGMRTRKAASMLIR